MNKLVQSDSCTLQAGLIIAYIASVWYNFSVRASSHV